jgi:hypothetical protein
MWNVRREAVFGPMPGNRPNSSINFWIGRGVIGFELIDDPFQRGDYENNYTIFADTEG